MKKSNFNSLSIKSEILICISIFLIALVLRGGLAWCGFQDCPQRFLRPDSMTYMIPACSLAENGTYAGTGRAPGFPVFIAMFCNKNGVFNFTGLIAVLIFFNILTILPIALIAKNYVRGKQCGKIMLFSALFWIFNVTAQANAPLILTDSFFAFIAAWQFYFVIAMWKRKNPYYLLAASCFSGVAALVRPINILWIWPLIILGLVCPNAVSLRKKILISVLSLAVFGAVVTPWQMRNTALNAGFTIDTNTGAMYHQNGAMLLAEVKHSDFETEKKQILTEQQKVFSNLESFPDEASRERYRMKKYIDLILAYPVTWIKQQFFNWRVLLPDVPTFLELTGNTLPNRGTMGVMAKDGLISGIKHYFSGNNISIGVLIALTPFIVITFAMYLIVAYMVIKMFINLKQYWFDILIFGSFVLYYLWLPGAITAPRYQLPALPWCCCLAAIGMASLKREADSQNPAVIQH